MEIVPLVMRFLRDGHLSSVPVVSHTWNAAANSYTKRTGTPLVSDLHEFTQLECSKSIME